MLVNGSWDDHHNWDTLVPALSQTFRALTYDRRGHGQGIAHEDMANLTGLITRLDIAPTHDAVGDGQDEYWSRTHPSLALRVCGDDHGLHGLDIVGYPNRSSGRLTDQPNR